MAKKQRDTIPYEHELVIRNFLGSADFVRLTLPLGMRGTLVSLLGYKVAPNGALIWNNIECKYRLGQNHSTNWVDTFDSDWETLCEAREDNTPADIDSAVNAESTDADVDSAVDASAREQTESN